MILAPNGRHLRVQHTYGWERHLLLLDPARKEKERKATPSGEAGVGEHSRNLKFSTHHQDQSMEILATREREVQLHTLEDRDAEALQERGRWSRSRSDSDRGRIRSKHRRTVPPRSTHVQPGDVSRALIQQGERERLGKTPSSSSTTAWW